MIVLINLLFILLVHADTQNLVCRQQSVTEGSFSDHCDGKIVIMEGQQGEKGVNGSKGAKGSKGDLGLGEKGQKGEEGNETSSKIDSLDKKFSGM